MREEISWETIKLDSERTPTYPNPPRTFKTLHDQGSLWVHGGRGLCLWED